jgi:glutaredoxin
MFTVISKPNCPYCDQAKALLKSKGLTYKAINIDVGQPRVEGEEYVTREAVLAEHPNLRTVPFITCGDIKIGGATELRRYLEQQTQQAA